MAVAVVGRRYLSNLECLYCCPARNPVAKISSEIVAVRAWNMEKSPSEPAILSDRKTRYAEGMSTERISPEYDAFTAAVTRIMSVPKAEILRREAEYKRQADLNPRKRGPKPKPERAKGK